MSVSYSTALQTLLFLPYFLKTYVLEPPIYSLIQKIFIEGIVYMMSWHVIYHPSRDICESVIGVDNKKEGVGNNHTRSAGIKWNSPGQLGNMGIWSIYMLGTNQQWSLLSSTTRSPGQVRSKSENQGVCLFVRFCFCGIG